MCLVADLMAIAIKRALRNSGGTASSDTNPEKEVVMVVTTEHISPIMALVAGFLILIFPSLLNYVIAIYLIIIGLVGLNGIYHFAG